MQRSKTNVKHVTCSAEETHSRIALTKTFPPLRTSCKKFTLSFIATIRVYAANNSFGNKILNYCPYSITRAAAIPSLPTYTIPMAKKDEIGKCARANLSC